jgi:hypothetical protein
MMEEIQPHASQINNPKYAVVLKKASFSWDQEPSVVHANGLDVEITGQHYSSVSSLLLICTLDLLSANCDKKSGITLYFVLSGHQKLQ